MSHCGAWARGKTRRTSGQTGFVVFRVGHGQARRNVGALIHWWLIGRTERRTSADRRDYNDWEKLYLREDKKTVPRFHCGGIGGLRGFGGSGCRV